MEAQIIPVFLPQAGCPHSCAFCNQQVISGENGFSLERLKEQFCRQEAWIKPSVKNEIAFYGGTFTGLNLRIQEDILRLAANYLQAGVAGSIRISTRPDYYSTENLELLKEYRVGTVELGIQSLDDQVLNLTGRGHTAAQGLAAMAFWRKGGMRVGAQLMVGLPGQDWQSVVLTALRIAAFRPELARIYPVLVIKGTELEMMYRSKKYQPLSLKEAVRQAAYVYQKLSKAGIKVIRIGLQHDDELCAEGNIIAGPFHSSLGEMVKAESYRTRLAEELAELSGSACNAEIICPSVRLSQVKGVGRNNESFWQEYTGEKKFYVRGEKTETRGYLRLAVSRGQ